jgi:CO/xanthine dehydrogenase Mo-binding subunit
MKNNKIDISRRKFLKVSLVVGSGLLVSVQLPSCNRQTTDFAASNEENPDVFMPNAWIKIGRDHRITVMVNHTELGQGITTALPMLIAEELEADWGQMRAEIAPAAKVYKNPDFNTQMTASSTSVRTSWEILRTAGATARELLRKAAAQTWGVPVSECRPEKSNIIHKASGKILRYGDLTEKAARLPIPEEVPLKDPSSFKIIGKRLPRLDTGIKTDGSALFGMDVRIPGMLVATVIHAPIIGARPKSVNSVRAKSLPGVRQVLNIESGIAVVADAFWQAKNGAEALEIEWDESEAVSISSPEIQKRLAGLAETEGKTIYEVGDPVEVFEKSASSIQAVYELPYQAHATPEPMNCTAHVREDGCDIWAPTQHQDASQEIASKITGFDYESINVHTTFTGGGFGRRIYVDYVAEAVRISRAMKKPVKLIWTREEDTRNDYYRPTSYNVLKAAVDSNGLPVAWEHRIVGADHMAHGLPKLLPSMLPYGTPRLFRNLITSLAEYALPRVIPGKKAIEGAAPLPYDIRNVRVNFINDDPGIPLGFWRSVAHSSNAFVVESFIDEIAAVRGLDPYELRYRLASKTPRLQNVLKLAAKKSGWHRKPPQGIFRGLAAHEFHDTMLVFVAEVSVKKNGEVKVHRVVCAVDCGVVINPKIVEAQMEGGIAFGLTATLKSSITIRKGRVEQSNFDDFTLLRIDEMPRVEVHLVKSNHPPTGIGEAAVPMIAPAVANAIYSATGRRIRKLPILPEDLSKG